MIDLNSASLADIAATGLAPALVQEIQFWRPYRSWDQLLMVGDLDDVALGRLKGFGFGIAAADDTAWTAPSPFKLSDRSI